MVKGQSYPLEKQYAGIINEDELQEEIIRFVSSFNKRVTYGKKSI